MEYFAKFVREHRQELGTIIWKDTPPQHFDFENGYYWYGSQYAVILEYIHTLLIANIHESKPHCFLFRGHRCTRVQMAAMRRGIWMRRWFDDSKGGTSGGPKSERCRALTQEELSSEEVLAGGWFNQVAFEVVRASGISVLNAYNQTLPLWDFHLKDKDCTHFCNPSAYELWTYLLKEHLKHLQPWLPA